MRRCCGRPSSSAKTNLERSARILTEIGMHAEAAEVLMERARLSPRNPLIWNDLGVEYMAAGQPDKAAAAFTRAHAVFPEYPLPLYNLGRLAMGRCIEKQAEESSSSDTVRKFANEAVGFLTGCLERDPLLIPAHSLLSTAYEVLGNEVQAGRHRQEASRLGPLTAVKSKVLWLAKIPLLKKFGPSTVPLCPPFLSSKDPDTSGNAH
jgi:tetratricopeptide (TPR) repeat protein